MCEREGSLRGEGSDADSGQTAGEEGEESGLEGFCSVLSEPHTERERSGSVKMTLWGGADSGVVYRRRRRRRRRPYLSAMPARSCSSSPTSRSRTCCLKAAGQPSLWPVLRMKVVMSDSSSLGGVRESQQHVKDGR